MAKQRNIMKKVYRSIVNTKHNNRNIFFLHRNRKKNGSTKITPTALFVLYQ